MTKLYSLLFFEFCSRLHESPRSGYYLGENLELKEIVKALIVNMKSLEHRLAAVEAELRRIGSE